MCCRTRCFALRRLAIKSPITLVFGSPAQISAMKRLNMVCRLLILYNFVKGYCAMLKGYLKKLIMFLSNFSKAMESDSVGALTCLISTVKETNIRPLSQWPTHSATVGRVLFDDGGHVYQCQALKQLSDVQERLKRTNAE